MRYLVAILLLCVSTRCWAASPIPLAEMLTTSGQSGLKQVREVFRDEEPNKSTNGYLRKIFEASPGASSVFLVDAETLPEAISASASVFVGARLAGSPVPVNKQNATRGNLWLVAHLGTAPSDPMRWVVESVGVDGDKIRLTYREPQSLIGTADSYPYFYWVPLGRLAAGAYEVELFDAGENAVTLMRRVKVEPTKKPPGS